MGNGVEPPRLPERATNRGCLGWALGALAALAVGLGFVLATRDDDVADVETSTAVSPTDPPATDPGVAPTDPPATDAPVATDAPLATDAPPATDSVTTDVDIGPPGTDGAPPPGAAEPVIPAPYAGVFDELDQAFGAEGLQGDVWFLAPDSLGDVVDCAGQNPVAVPGPDIAGVIGTSDGSTADIAALMAQSPLLTADGFSFAVLLQTLTAGGQQRLLQWEVHDEVVEEGELDAAGSIDPASSAQVTISDGAVRFQFPIDPSDPLAAIQIRGFNTPVDGDPIACDDLAATPINSAFPPTTVSGDCALDATTACLNNGRFAVTLNGPGGPASTTASQFDDAGGFESGDVGAWARVVNGCGVNDHFWVFAAATTDVEYELTVVDTASGATRAYDNPLSDDFRAITDTSAFATCP